jgi:hypothetical protein
MPEISYVPVPVVDVVLLLAIVSILDAGFKPSVLLSSHVLK